MPLWIIIGAAPCRVVPRRAASCRVVPRRGAPQVTRLQTGFGSVFDHGFTNQCPRAEGDLDCLLVVTTALYPLVPTAERWADNS